MAKQTINPETLTFGIEIECYVPESLDIAIGTYHRGLQITQLPTGWLGERDGSLNRPPVGYKAVEIVSPVLVGTDGLAQVVEVFTWLNTVNARVNDTCGFHVHVGIDPTRLDQLGKVACLVARHEKALYAITGTKSREDNRFCKPIKQDDRFTSRFRDKTLKVEQTYHLPSDRYVTFNLSNIAQDRRPAVEFRVFAGTTNLTKAVGYIQVCLGLVQRGQEMNRAAQWDINHKPVSKKGEGQNATKHLLVELGWTGTYASKTYGMVDAEGKPALDACVAELRRLAAKYDTRPEPVPA